MSCEVFINYKAKWKIFYQFVKNTWLEEKIGKIVNDRRREKRVSEKIEQIYQIVNDLKNKIRQFKEKLKDIDINFSKLSQIILRWSYKYWMGPTVMS